MDMDNAAAFLAGSILYAIGCIVILTAVIIANNIIAKYWKSFGWKMWPTWMHEQPSRFASQEEIDRIAPTLHNEKSKK